MPGTTPRPIRTPARFDRNVHPEEEIVFSNGVRLRHHHAGVVRVTAILPAGETARVQQRAKPAEGA